MFKLKPCLLAALVVGTYVSNITTSQAQYGGLVYAFPREVDVPLPPQRPAGLVAQSASRHGVPASLALALARRESGLRCSARGALGELGPLQINVRSARALGYRGEASGLNSCGAGLEYGMKHLAMCFSRAHGNFSNAIRCHQGGPAYLR